MQVHGRPFTSIWLDQDTQHICIIDQTLLPHRLEIARLTRLDHFCHAISSMQVRGAPLIGVTAAFGLAIALQADPSVKNEQRAADALLATRPTAVNLHWAIAQVRQSIATALPEERARIAMATAHAIRQQDIITCKAIGQQGLALIQTISQQKKPAGTVNILTHCNAGWLATVDWGTALAPIYKAHQTGLAVHVWVDETRPRNQGASLTAWELRQQGIPHTVIPDNTGGHLMQHGQVDLCLVGSDRTTANGDVCNKIGTYLKALAAADNDIPFYVALPGSTVDWHLGDGIREIPIEQRDTREVTHISGLNSDGTIGEVQLFADSPAANYGFDVTPAKLVSGLITENGIFDANANSLLSLKRLMSKPQP